MLVNINKLKPYRFIEDIILQYVLVKPSDLVINEPIQGKEFEPLPVELEDLQNLEFESINNPLTHGNIKGKDVHVQDNDVIVCNDQNDAFSATFINVYILEVYNLKVYVYSQP
jgi:hypothetical protein